MKKKILSVVCIAVAVTMLGCKNEKTAIEGKWQIELEPMLQQAKSLGASSRQIQQVRETFMDGRMNIDGQRIKLTIPGVPGDEVYEYKVLSKQGQCLNLEIRPSNAIHKYCPEGSRLEVHDPSTKLIATYRKS